MRRRLAFGIALGGSVVIACQLLAGIDDRTLGDSGITEDGGVDPCSIVNLPGAPISPPPDTNPITVTAALSQIMLGATDGGPYYGFNLDKTCTCPDVESCVPQGDAGAHCDDDGGIDNYARRAFEQINAVSSAFGDAGGLITEKKLNLALTSGLSGALIEISKYNGQSDDGQVTVTIYASQGFDGYPDAAPAFDGKDHWIVDPGSASGQYSTTNAYVVGFTLVATGLNFPIVIGSATTQPVTIQLDEGIIEAKLVMSGNQLVSLTGVLGGRWDPAKFLPSLQSVPDPYFGGYLCGNDPVYGVVKNIICGNTDINVSSAGDHSGPCNSVSMGLGFQALPAMMGNVGSYVDAGQPCGATWKDSCNN
ncbi:MAG TPA: hypothetical protein VGH28_22570 [Polyangiaceae bacterium]|jgi:hypothetical protein